MSEVIWNEWKIKNRIKWNEINKNERRKEKKKEKKTGKQNSKNGTIIELQYGLDGPPYTPLIFYHSHVKIKRGKNSEIISYVLRWFYLDDLKKDGFHIPPSVGKTDKRSNILFQLDRTQIPPGV